jgi:drug/metabolite transporter (DMT)-like permease
MLAVALGLASGLSWGVADFLGGIASRRASAIAVVAVSQAAGLALALIALGIVRPEAPPASHVALGLAAGASGAVGLAAFYRGLAIGTMGLVAPVSALGALVPLVVDLAAGRSPGPLALTGMAVALAGAALAASAPGRATRRGLGLAVVAALGFGGFFVLLAEAADQSVLWALTSARTASVPLAVVAALAVGAGLRIGREILPVVVLAGILDASANMMFAEGSQRGLVSVVAVLGSLYPVATIALASVVLKERLGPLQAAGAAIALVGVVMIAAG